MKRHKVAVATAAAVAASAFAAGTLAPGAQAWGDKCPPGNHDKQYCEHHHHHHHHHRNPLESSGSAGATSLTAAWMASAGESVPRGRKMAIRI